MARFFIDRPIFAWVIAIVIILGGLLAVRTMPLEQYPDIAPPTISIQATYPGASAKTLQNSVTQVIEQQMTGLNNLLYISSTSSDDGTAEIRLTFANGTNPDIAQVQVQNKLQSALARLPQAVQNQGVQVTQAAGDIFLVLALVSQDGSMTQADIGNYISSTLEDPLSRVNGVGQVDEFGSEYAMRIWLNPKELDKYNLMPSDIETAIQAQNTDVAAGSIGGLPAVPGQEIDATITARSRLTSVKQFKNIIVKSQPNGAAVHLNDVAKVMLGSEDYSEQAMFNGKPAAGLGIELAPNANAVKTAQAVEARLKQLEPYFPHGLKAKVAYDTTPFVRLSIREVVKTLIEAIVLVVLIMFLFLQSVRATLIPTMAVPVVILGTFAVLSLLGFSINTLTMFALVLAIGLLVDDAIVVVENVERLMAEKNLSPREATKQSMDEISGALIGIALVLSSVFVPMAFLGGVTGAIYRQFSITIAVAMLLSVLVALTLSPALCASLLKPTDLHSKDRRGFFGWFNRGFERSAHAYRRGVEWMITHRFWMIGVFAVIIGLVAFLFTHLPSEFLPTEDQGVLMVEVKLPTQASRQRTQRVMDQVQSYFQKQPDVKSIFMVSGGGGHGGGGQNTGRAFVHLTSWSQRRASAEAIASKATQVLSRIRDAQVFVLQPPAIHHLGNASGFQLELEDIGGLGHTALIAAKNKFLKMAKASNAISEVRSEATGSSSQFSVHINDAKASALDLNLGDINSTLSAAFGGTYVDDFIYGGRVKKVYMQGNAPYRMQPKDISDWYVRNSDGNMVPFSAFSSSYWTYGPTELDRYNGVGAYEIDGQPASGVSSSQAMAEVVRLVGKLGSGIGYEWSGISYQQELAGNQAPLLYAISILFVFLCLAALYESWSIPLSVMLVVPLGVLGALSAMYLRGIPGDVYFQVGLLTTIGLSAKNAILIVEYASTLEKKGESLLTATLHAVRLRLRPIVMTSMAFGMGVLPLVISTGAGAGARNAVGTGVFGGVIAASTLGIFFVPVFFILVRAGWRRLDRSDELS